MKNIQTMPRIIILVLSITVLSLLLFKEKQKPRLTSKADVVSMKESAVKKYQEQRVDAQKQQRTVSKANANKRASTKGQLIKLARELKAINARCEHIAEDIFKDSDYIDPEHSLYKNATEVKGKIDRIFNEMLLQEKAKTAFQAIVKEANLRGENGTSPESWSILLTQIDVCRENEVFYFFETLFESFRYKYISKTEKAEINQYFLHYVGKLLKQQQTMSNLLFVTNLIIKSTKTYSQDNYLINESKRLFDDLIEYWRINNQYYNERTDGQKKKMDIDFYKDYFKQTDFYYLELSKILDEHLN